MSFCIETSSIHWTLRLHDLVSQFFLFPILVGKILLFPIFFCLSPGGHMMNKEAFFQNADWWRRSNSEPTFFIVYFLISRVFKSRLKNDNDLWHVRELKKWSYGPDRNRSPDCLKSNSSLFGLLAGFSDLIAIVKILWGQWYHGCYDRCVPIIQVSIENIMIWNDMIKPSCTFTMLANFIWFFSR